MLLLARKCPNAVGGEIAIVRGFAGKARPDATLDNGKQPAPSGLAASRNAVRLKRRHRFAKSRRTQGGVVIARATAFLFDRGLNNTLVQNCSDRRKAASAARAAAEAFIDSAQRLRAKLALNGVPDIRVAKNIARTNNHKVTGFNLENAG